MISAYSHHSFLFYLHHPLSTLIICNFLVVALIIFIFLMHFLVRKTSIIMHYEEQLQPGDASTRTAHKRL